MSSAGPSAIPIRSGLLRVFQSRERVSLRYDPALEDVPLTSTTEDEIISDEHLRAIDRELAPYPFAGLDRWRRLTSHISQAVLDEVLGPSGRVDGLLQVDGDEEGDDLARAVNGSERTMRFPTFKLKRSWREGAVGDEVTRYAKDKSWLMGHVATSSLGSGESSRSRSPYQLMGST